MSRAYRIRVKESIIRDIAASDEVCSDLEMLEVLPAEQMGQLLEAELKGRGYVEEEGKLTKKLDDGITVRVDAKNGTVSVKADTVESVELEAQRDHTGYDDVGPSAEMIRQKLADQLKQDLERRADQQAARLQEKASAKLEGKLADVQKEMNSVISRVTSEALKIKAQSLGQIKEIAEDAQAGSLTIVLEV